MKNSLIRQYLFLFFMSCIISGCGSGKENTSSQTVTAELHNKIYMDEIANMPILDRSSHPSYTVRIHNHSNTDYKLAGVKVLDLDTHKEQKDLLSVQSLTANQILANQSSAIKILVNAKHSVSVKLVLTLKDLHGKSIELEKIIRIANHSFAEQQIIGEKDFNSVANIDDTYTIAVPILLAKTFDEVTSNEGKLECDSYKKGASCTLFLDGKISLKSQDIDLRLTGYHNGKKYPLNTKVSVSYGNKPNLIFSYDSIMSGSQIKTITLTNNGTDSATNLDVTTDDANVKILKPATNQCSDTLDSGLSCQYTVNISGASRSTEFKVSYQGSSQNTIKLTKKILYLADLILPRVILSTISGSLNGSQLNIENTARFEIENTGNSKLSNLTLRLPHSLLVAREFRLEPVANSPRSCKINSDFELAATNGSCEFLIKYIPSANQNLSELSLNLNGIYIDELGKQQNYFQILPISYSATNQVSLPNVSLEFKPGFSGDLDVPFDNNPSNTFIANTVLTLTNSSATPIKLSFNGTNPDFLTFSATSNNSLDYSTNCGTTLAANRASCEITIHYGPGLNQEIINDLTATVNYDYGGTAYNTISLIMTLRSENIAVASASLQGQFSYHNTLGTLSENIHYVDGDGSQNNPYRIYVFNVGMIGGVSYQINNISQNSFANYIVGIRLDDDSVKNELFGAGALYLSGRNIPISIQPMDCSFTAAASPFAPGNKCFYNVRFPAQTNLTSTNGRGEYRLADNFEGNWKSNAFVPYIQYLLSGLQIFNINIDKVFFAVNYAWMDIIATTQENPSNPDELNLTISGQFPLVAVINSAELNITVTDLGLGVTLSTTRCSISNGSNPSCIITATKPNTIDWKDVEFKIKAFDPNLVASYDVYKLVKGG